MESEYSQSSLYGNSRYGGLGTGMPTVRPMDVDDLPPPFELSRRTSLTGNYVEMDAGTPESYHNDMLVYFSRSYALDNSDPVESVTTVTWDFVSPDANHNQTSRGSAASFEFRYTSTGDKSSDFDASSLSEVKRWDVEHPTGSEYSEYDNSPVHHDEALVFCGVNARDIGVWTIKETIDGVLNETLTFEVLDTPAAGNEFSRYNDGSFADVTPIPEAAISDEWLVLERTYDVSGLAGPTLQGPESNLKRTVIEWHWYAPDSSLNTNIFGAYLTRQVRYYERQDGTRYWLRRILYDPSSVLGKPERWESFDASPPANHTVTYGCGLPVSGTWTIQEVVNGVQTDSDTVEVRPGAVELLPVEPTFIPANGGNHTFQFSVETAPTPTSSYVVEFHYGVDIVRVDTPTEEHITTLQGFISSEDPPGFPQGGVGFGSSSQQPEGSQAQADGPSSWPFGGVLLIPLDWDGTLPTGGYPSWPGRYQARPFFFWREYNYDLYGWPNQPSNSSNYQLPAQQFSMMPPPSLNAYTTLPGNLNRQLDLGSGQHMQMVTDLVLRTKGLPIVIARYHRSEEQSVHPQYGWRWSYQRELRISGNRIVHVKPDGTRDGYVLNGAIWEPARDDITAVLDDYGANGYVLTLKNKTRFYFEIPLSGPPNRAVLVREENRNGVGNDYLWTATGEQLTRITDPAGREVNFTWAATLLPFSITDWTGRRVEYTYHFVNTGTLGGTLATVTATDDSVATYDYYRPPSNRNLRHLVSTALSGGSGLQEKLSLGAPGVLSEITSSQGARTTYARQQLDPVTGFTSESTLSSIASTGTQTWKHRLDATGHVLEVEDPNQKVTAFTYDTYENIDNILNAKNQSTDILWDSRRNPTQINDHLDHQTDLLWQSDNLKKITRYLDGTGGAGIAVETSFTFDINEINLVEIADPLNHKTTFDYNADGTLKWVKNHDGFQRNFFYDANGYLIQLDAPGDDGDRSVWNFLVDGLGRRTRVTDPEQNSWDYEYDPRDRVKKITLPAVGGGVRPTLQYNWGHNDLLQSVVDPEGKTTSFYYNGALQLIRVVDPELDETQYTYDSFGNVATIVNPRGKTTSFTYDGKNRLTRIDYPGGDYEQYTYDDVDNLTQWDRGPSQAIVYEYDDINRLRYVKPPGGASTQIEYQYDTLHRRKKMIDPGSQETEYVYDLASRLTAINRPGSRNLAMAYDSLNRLTSITDPESVVTSYTWTDRSLMKTATQDGQTFTYGYDKVGNLTSKTYPNGMELTQIFDERNRLEEMRYEDSQAVLFLKLAHTYNQAGHLTELERTDVGSVVTKYRYTYDDRYQLESVEKDTGGGYSQVEDYEYDPNQNRTLANGDVFGFDDADQFQSGLSATYNDDGATTAITFPGMAARSITYDFRDMPTQIAESGGFTADYAYDGANQRISRDVDGDVTEYLWAGAEVVKEYDDQGAVKAQYLLGLGREGIKVDGNWHFFLADHLGSTTHLVDVNEAVSASYEYDAWGNLLNSTGSVYNPFRYTGQQFDDAEEQYYLRARYYAPQVGRFLVRDPIGYEGGLNLYAYTQNNPVNFVDPSGLQTGVADPDWNPATGQPGPNPYPELGRELVGAYEEALIEIQEADPSGRAVDVSVDVVLTVIPGGKIAKTVGSSRRGLVISQQNLSALERYVGSFGDVPYNRAMVQRIRQAAAQKQPLSQADLRFFIHERTEALFRQQGLSSEAAHEATLKILGQSPYSVYAPQVVKEYPEWFNDAWRAFWGIKK